MPAHEPVATAGTRESCERTQGRGGATSTAGNRTRRREGTRGGAPCSARSARRSAGSARRDGYHIGHGPALASREGETLSTALSRPRRSVSNAIRQQEDRQARVRPGMLEQMRRSDSASSKTVASAATARTRRSARSTTLAVLGHLRGKHVMGVYPMLPDETCWFLAVDFDKSTWKEDVRAFAETARRLELPVLVERSRSGNGAHVWFFFSEPVPASVARKMGCHVITETMSSRHELSMDSYDRLFPSQDTMPRGGFGNLIALPLQYGLVKRGNSVFLDDQLERVRRRPAVVRSCLGAAHLRSDRRTDRRRGDAHGNDHRRAHRGSCRRRGGRRAMGASSLRHAAPAPNTRADASARMRGTRTATIRREGRHPCRRS